MKFFLLLCCYGVLGALADEGFFDTLWVPSGGVRIEGVSTECREGALNGEIYDRIDLRLLCKRYPDGSSYAKIVSCEIGGAYVARGYGVGAFRCTARGIQKSGQFPSWVIPYARRGEKPGSRVLSTHEEIESDQRQEDADRAEMETAVAAARKSLGSATAPATELPLPSPSIVDTENFPTPSELDGFPSTTINPDCDELTGDCYFPTGLPGIKYPSDPNTDIDKNKIKPGTPDCDELTQDCYFPNVPSTGAEEFPKPTPIEIPTTTTVPPRPLPNTCTFNGKQAKPGQQFIVGDLYVLKCLKAGKNTELRFAGCLTPTRGTRANENHPKGFQGSLRNFDFPRHNKGSQFECRGEFVPDQLAVV